MERAINVYWKTYDFGKTVVCVDISDVEDQTKYFGFVFETKARRKPADSDARLSHWTNNVSSQLRGQVNSMINGYRDVLDDFQITTGEHHRQDVDGYNTFTIDDSFLKWKGKDMQELWKKREAAKAAPIPSHWPLSGRKTTPEIEEE